MVTEMPLTKEEEIYMKLKVIITRTQTEMLVCPLLFSSNVTLLFQFYLSGRVLRS